MPPNPTPDNYVGTPGSPVAAGRYLNPVATADASGGTVTMLLKDWAGTGIQLLSELPAQPTYAMQGHAGSVWDSARNCMWIFGADTHTSDMWNAVYRWDAKDGLVKRQYASDAVGGYHVTTDGYPYANAANSRPWAMHTFRCMWYDDTTKELGVAMNSFEHAGITPKFDGSAFDVDTGKKPMWMFNTVTGTWRMWDQGETSAYNKVVVMGAPVTYHKGIGWVRWVAPYADKLSESGVRSNVNLWGKMQPGIQQFAHKYGSKVVLMGGDQGDIGLFSKHDMGDLEGSSAYFTIAEFPVLSGWSLKNFNSALDPATGKIVFVARKPATGEIRAFVLDWDKATPTVTDTGYSFGTGISADTRYQLKAEWCSKYNCALFVLNVVGGATTDRVYGVRI